MSQPEHARGRRTGAGAQRRRRLSCIGICAAAATGGLAGLPAEGTVTGDGVVDGHSITVLHNIDMVSALGWTPGERIRVSVLRDDVTVGTATGTAVTTVEGAGLEVNHEGAPAPGDCWDGTTPDIQPGDVVKVTNGTLTDEVTVDDIRFTGRPTVEAGTGDVLMSVFARRHDGTPFTAAELDVAEFRGGGLRADIGGDPAYMRVEAVDATNGRFRIRYVAPFAFQRNREGLSPDEIRRLLLTETSGHMIGFGHTEPAADAQIIEGLGQNTAPAAGCEGAPMARYAVTELSLPAINLANRGSGLTVGGVSEDSGSVRVRLRSDTTGVLSEPVTPAPATGSQTWTVRFTAEQLTGLADGLVTVSATYTDAGSGSSLTGRTSTIVKDLVAPAPPSASVPGGSYLGRQDVSLNADPTAGVRYTLGDGSQPAPTATSGSRYPGGRIAITSSRVLKTVAVDSAGNVSDVASERYSIVSRITPARPRIGDVTADPHRMLVRWAPPPANGGPPVEGYRIRVYRRTRPVRTLLAGPDATRRTVRRLANDHWYRFTVQARNSVGYGVASVRSDVVFLRGTPTRPRIRRAFPGARGGRDTARTTWAAPRSDGGRRITGYRVVALRPAGNGSVASRHTSPMLRPGARARTMRLPAGRYRFRVYAFNRLGRSALSPRSNRVRAR
ncbi:MAG: fibronectin type III domain-containing protein [Actinomycetota bacterium]|nr:fibronectin type III domain-containing protein [Actinomycetota bacterium]